MIHVDLTTSRVSTDTCLQGSTIFRHEDAPNYTPGIWATVGMLIVFMFVTGFLSWFFTAQNWRADQGIEEKLEGVKGFRYAP